MLSSLVVLKETHMCGNYRMPPGRMRAHSTQNRSRNVHSGYKYKITIEKTLYHIIYMHIYIYIIFTICAHFQIIVSTISIKIKTKLIHSTQCHSYMFWKSKFVLALFLYKLDTRVKISGMFGNTERSKRIYTFEFAKLKNVRTDGNNPQKS